MSVTVHAYEHLDCSNPDRPLIAGKNFKVIHLIREHVAYGWSAEEMALKLCAPEQRFGRWVSIVEIAGLGDRLGAGPEDRVAEEADAVDRHGRDSLQWVANIRLGVGNCFHIASSSIQNS